MAELTDSPRNDGSGDELDEQLLRAAEFLTGIEAPDVWPDVLSRSRTRSSSQRHPLRHVAAAAIVLMIGLGAATLFGDSGESVSLTTAAQPHTTPGAPGPTTLGLDLSDVGDECSQDLVADLRSGASPELMSGASDSPEQLSLTSAAVVRGEITEVRHGKGGSLLYFELDEDTDPTIVLNESGLRPGFWTPGFPSEDFRAPFVAFITTQPSGQRNQLATLTHFDGLWVACDTESPAASLNGAPTGGGWATYLDDGMSLDELWDLAAFPDGAFTSEVSGVPMQNEANVFDVQLIAGDRLRLAIPTELGETLTVGERRAPLPVLLDNERIRAQLFFEPCQGGSLGPNGAFLDFDGAALSLCRPDEGIRLEVTSIDGSPLPTHGWDVAPMQLGSRLGPFVASYASLPGCEGCARFGPLYFNEVGESGANDNDVIVYRASEQSVHGYDAGDLSFLWGVDFDAPVVVRRLDDLVIVDVFDGPLVALDPKDGAERWRIRRAVGESDTMIDGYPDGVVLVRSSFDREGFEEEAPIMRRIVAATGEVLWTARAVHESSHRKWTVDRPVLIDGRVIALNRATSLEPDAVAPILFSFDLESGEAGWSLWLTGRGEPTTDSGLSWVEVESGKVVLFRTDYGELVRVDPGGEQLWSIEPGIATVDGTDFAADGSLAISLRAVNGRILVDPDTGDLAFDSALDACTTLVGVAPWITLFDGRWPGCVIAADFQDIRIVNKGSATTTVPWGDGETIALRSDEVYETERAGWALTSGMSSFAGAPYAMDDIWLMPPSASPTAGFRLVDGRFGPVAVGMTTAEASEALGRDLVIEDAFFSGCRIALVGQDPYSPLFAIEGDGADAQIVAIVPATQWPDGFDQLRC